MYKHSQNTFKLENRRPMKAEKARLEEQLHQVGQTEKAPKMPTL